MPIQVDCYCSFPIFWGNGIDGCCRSGDASIVDEHIETTEVGFGFCKKLIYLACIRNVGDSGADLGQYGIQVCNGIGINIAHMNVRTASM